MDKKKRLIIAAVAAAVLAGVILLLIFLPKGGSGSDDATYDEGIDMVPHIDENGVHQVEIVTDENGNIKNNSFGTLIDYVPAQIKEIHVENAGGTFDVDSNTPEGEATVYTIRGFEGLELQAGEPDVIANAAASLEFSKVATLDKAKGGEFGFDSPRSVVTVTYTDGTKAVYTVGSDAPQAAGTYIKFGTGDAVFVVSTETVAPFDYKLTDLVSKTINNSADTEENAACSSIKLSGAAFDGEIELVPNTGGKLAASYMLKAPAERAANESESSKITGGIRGLYATEALMVNPSEAQLGELGLSEPYARVKAVYPDGTVELIASKPDGDGNTALMAAGGSVVYEIAADKVPWVTTSYKKLVGEYALYPKMSAVSAVSVKSGGKTYDFALDSRESVTTDDDGNETVTTITTVKYGGKEADLGSFTEFYDAASLIGVADPDAQSEGTAVLEITYTYPDGGSDKVVFGDNGGDMYSVTVNGKAFGGCYKADITRAVNAIAVATGENR